ncbi:hypothetical protein ALC56_08423 [Trachymyrmex septentrionalis]|uniref:Uncharacterized protein n=1 Tax=Trachymyrmex septentrionalis TaxID=34720 RepID=A0A195F861_9HYME|nr:hypothetical protein ALC56_08423 [Trachymyrmex septentrionalis]
MRSHTVLLLSTMTMILDMIEDYLLLRDYNVLALLFAKSQSRVLEVSDESVETNLANFEFPVSLYLLKEGRKDRISMVWLIGAGTITSTILLWRKNIHQSVSKFVGMKHYSVVEIKNKFRSEFWNN